MIRRVLALVVALAPSLSAGMASATDHDGFAFDMHDVPVTLPDLAFSGPDGLARTLADYRGRYVLVNVWATWCAPCRDELPTLDALQRALGGPEFEVIALSIDTGRRTAVERLFEEVSMAELEVLIDDTGSAMRDLGLYALPTTLLIDGDGREVGRKIGPAFWGGPAAIDFFEALP